MTTAIVNVPFVLSFANMKGGVGKSTAAMLAADALSRFARRKVLIIDLDPQANAAQMILGFDGLQSAHASSATLTFWLKEITLGTARLYSVVTTNVSGISEVRTGENGELAIIPATPELRFAELAFDHAHYSAADRAAPRKAMIERLRQGISELGMAYDVVLFDCPPGFTTLAQAALSLSDAIISPILEDPVSLWSLKAFKDFGLDRELGVWNRSRHRVLYSRVRNQGAITERLQLRNDVLLAGFDALATSIKENVQAMRWTQRPSITSTDTFRSKYGTAHASVKALGEDIEAFMASVQGIRGGGSK